jgi:hypothetical protein
MSQLSGAAPADDNSNTSSSSNNNIDTNRCDALAALPSGYNATIRLKKLFSREGVLFANPINAQDKGMLGQVAHIIDQYFATEEYIRDFGHGHHNVVIGDMMVQTGGTSEKASSHWAVVMNAHAFYNDASVKHDAAQRKQLHAQWEKQRRGALSEAKRLEFDEKAADETALVGETSLRKANQVEIMLEDIDMEDELDYAEFEAQFEEPELEEEFAEMDLGVEFAEMDLGVEKEEKEMVKELAGMEIEE